jgi:hypothetical protein
MTQEMQTNDTNDAGLVVPVDLTALCVGIIDQNDQKNGTIKFAGATTVYTNQAGQNDAYVGTNVVRALSAPPWQQLTTGIHLHWAMPNALTRGANDTDGNVAFTGVPNRWLISRTVIAKNGPVRSSWIIESDVLNASLPAGQLAVTLPVKNLAPSDADFMYAGQYKLFDGSWRDPGSGNFPELTGQQLSAVSSGDASFAAFYPSCRSLFGFQDTLADLNITPNDPPANIMYELTGWFSSPATDPLYGGKTRDQLNSQYSWTYDGTAVTTSYSLYSGMIQDIAWNPYNKYVVDQANQTPIDAMVSIGNTPPESFAAYFKDKLHPDIEFFETLLNAFQNGLLSEFMDPKPDQLAVLQEKLHQATFASDHKGSIYQIVRPEKDSPDEVDIPLPLALAQALNLLNVYQQQADFYSDYVGSFQWQLFADWYKLVKATDLPVQNTLYQILYNNLGRVWPQIQTTSKQLTDQLEAQETTVTNLLNTFDKALQLKETPGARYWQPNEPVVMIAADNISNVIRSRALKANYDENGYLHCRTTDQLITVITVKGSAIRSEQFSAAGLPSPNNLPYPGPANELLLESFLLNTNLISETTGIAAADLEIALNAALQGIQQNTYTFDGVLPSAIEIQWWHSNPWFPIFLEWRASYQPLEATEANGELIDYTPSLFTNNYSIDQDRGGEVTYQGSLDPATIDFSTAQEYRSSAIISNSAAMTFLDQLEQYLGNYPNPTLRLIADQLKAGVFASAPFSGFNGLLAMRQQSIQLNINVTPQNPYYSITQLVAQVAGNANTVSPVPNGYFNPVRAGFLKFGLTLIDMYGQKREVAITKTITSQQLTSWYRNLVVPNIAYISPAMAQPVRLYFRWLSAIGDEIQEMNDHPATTPVCGWFLPNHLDGSLFIYDQQGRSMGTLGMNGNQTAMVWQSAPGNNNTINQSIEQVFALQNPQLRDIALALYNNGPAFFTAFWRAIDNMHNFIDPQNYAQNSDLAVLIGRPVALAQTILRLELDSSPVMNQSYLTITSDNYSTDNGSTNVEFPVILGDLKQINDGLIGYFLQKDSGYDLTTFYTQGADAAANNGVIRPAADTLTLTTSPALGSALPYDLQSGALRVLMLFDPRATIHATTGILPTKSIDIPSNQYANILGILEMTFLTSPVLKGVTGFNMPLPGEEGYQWSWVEETAADGLPAWKVTPEIAYVGGQAIADYTPQTIREGWLRLNPVLLHFELLNSQGQPAAVPNAINVLGLTITNRKPAEVTFTPGELKAQGLENSGSLIYIHFGALVDQVDVPSIQFSATNWSFKSLNDTRYGNYWAATPTRDLSLASGDELLMQLANLRTADLSGQVQVYFEYFNITGLNDGVDAALITLKKTK